MALADIIRALDEQANTECEDILCAARAQAEAIAEDAVRQSEEICSVWVDKSRTAARLKAVKATNAARLEARKRVASVKEEAIDQAFESAAKRLESLRASPEYPEVFRALVTEAVADIEDEMVFLADPKDESFAATVVKELGLRAAVRPEISTSGGLVVITGGGRIMRRNTIEDRLEKVKQGMRSQVAEILFS